jgi:hypothetical protein
MGWILGCACAFWAAIHWLNSSPDEDSHAVTAAAMHNKTAILNVIMMI